MFCQNTALSAAIGREHAHNVPPADYEIIDTLCYVLNWRSVLEFIKLTNHYLYHKRRHAQPLKQKQKKKERNHKLTYVFVDIFFSFLTRKMLHAKLPCLTECLDEPELPLTMIKYIPPTNMHRYIAFQNVIHIYTSEIMIFFSIRLSLLATDKPRCPPNQPAIHGLLQSPSNSEDNVLQEVMLNNVKSWSWTMVNI